MMSDMCIQNSHLTTSDTCTYVWHTVVVTNLCMLVVGISITGLSCMPHHVVGIFPVLADESTTTRSSNHLIAIKWKDTKASKGTENPAVEARAHAFGCILNDWDIVFIGNCHNFFAIIWHTVKSYWDNCFRIFAGLLLTVKNRLLQEFRIHVPCFTFRVDEHWPGTKISDRMGWCTEGETLYTYLISRFYATGYQSKVHRSSTGTQANHPMIQLTSIRIGIGKIWQGLLEGIHIRAHRNHPIGIECFLYIFLFQTSLTHVSKTEVDSISFFNHNFIY